VKIEGIDKVRAWIETRKKRLKNPTPFLKTCSQILGTSAGKTFNVQGRPRWAARKDNKTHPILDLTGELRDSVEQTTSGGHAIVKITRSSGKAWLDKGTDLEYGGIQQVTGVGKAKTKRPFLLFQDEDVEEITTKAEDFLCKD
jgi:phage gpG-like protein